MGTKSCVFVLALLLAASIPAVAAADAQAETYAGAQAQGTSAVNNVEVDSSTQAEVEATASAHGARMRLLQLELAVAKNIIKGQAVIDAIKESNTSANTTKLEAIVAEMDALQAQVRAAKPEAAAQGSASARQFVELKYDAIDLSQEFREEAMPVVKAEAMAGLRQEANAKAEAEGNAELKELKTEIKTEKHEYNAGRMQLILQAMGRADAIIVAKVRAGEMDADEAREFVKAQFRSMPEEARKEAALEIKEDLSERSALGISVLNSVKMDYDEKRDERSETRIKAVSDQGLRAILIARLSIPPAGRTNADAGASANPEAGTSGNENARAEVRAGVALE